MSFLTLRYNFPEELLKKVCVSSASLSFDVTNPFVVKSKDLKGRDPEQVTRDPGLIPPQRGTR